jgi:hypothetical protein
LIIDELQTNPPKEEDHPTETTPEKMTERVSGGEQRSHMCLFALACDTSNNVTEIHEELTSNKVLSPVKNKFDE